MSVETKTDMVTLTIDGQTVTVPKGTVLVDAAKTVDIEIPVFCYHEKLGPFGCCRMCLVEVEKMPKLMTACTMAAGEGMVVNTKNKKVEKAQQGVLEFTLLNHPLDCPVCDKGGECPLQDNTFKFGPPDTRMQYDRQNRDKATPLSPVITIDRERCIACQRCTRYSEIIETEQALVMLNRGFKNRVSTFNDRPYDTKFSGNVIDICPVGALTNTDFRFSARSWDLDNTDTTCGHCSCNCNLTLGTRLNEVKRVTTNPNDAVDDGWICDKGRWGYDFTNSKNRILSARKDNVELPVGEAAKQVAEKLKSLVDEHGPDSVGFLGSPYALNESLYLYQKMFRQGLGTNNIDHKSYDDSPGLPVDQADFSDIETADWIIMIGADPSEEMPILDLRIKKAVTRKGVKLAVFNDKKTDLDKLANLSHQYDVGDGAQICQGLSSAAASKKDSSLPMDIQTPLKELFKKDRSLLVIYNPEHVAGNAVKAFINKVQKLSQTGIKAMSANPATNATGAMDMGIVPDFYPGGVPLTDKDKIKKLFGENAPLTAGMTATQMFEKAGSGQLKALVVYRSNPIVDFPGGAKLKEALEKLDLLVVHDMLETETSRLAHVVIPSQGPGFDEGTTTNPGGRVQKRSKALSSDSPQDYEIIQAMLGQVIEDSGSSCDWASLIKEISGKVAGYEEVSKKNLRKNGVLRGSVRPNSDDAILEKVKSETKAGFLKLRVSRVLFRHDKILDAESPLAHQFQSAKAYLNQKDAKEKKLVTGDKVDIVSGEERLKVEVEVSELVNPGGILIPDVSDEQGVMRLINSRASVTHVEVKKSE